MDAIIFLLLAGTEASLSHQHKGTLSTWKIVSSLEGKKSCTYYCSKPLRQQHLDENKEGNEILLAVSVRLVCFVYLTVLCGESVLLVCISTSLPSGRWWLCWVRAGRELTFVPSLVLATAAKVRWESNRKTCIYTENRLRLYRMPLCFVLFKTGLQHAWERRSFSPQPLILLPSPDRIFTALCSLPFNDRSVRRLGRAGFEMFQVVGVLWIQLRPPLCCRSKWLSGLLRAPSPGEVRVQPSGSACGTGDGRARGDQARHLLGKKGHARGRESFVTFHSFPLLFVKCWGCRRMRSQIFKMASTGLATVEYRETAETTADDLVTP